MEKCRRGARIRGSLILLALVPVVVLSTAYAITIRDRAAPRGVAATIPGCDDDNDEGPTELALTVAALRTLRRAGMPAEDPSVVRAVGFLSRLQEPAGPSNRHARGFASGRVIEVPAGPSAGQGSPRRPSGDVTCLGLSGLLSAGVEGDDPRVQAAVAWIEAHYTLEVNPGAEPPRRGLYRYYLEFASAMTAMGVDRIRDAGGGEHDWRAELAARLSREQQADGSWANPQESAVRAEGSIPVVTSYALLTLRLILESDAIRRPAVAR